MPLCLEAAQLPIIGMTWMFMDLVSIIFSGHHSTSTYFRLNAFERLAKWTSRVKITKQD